jgi:hypothetical protein
MQTELADGEMDITWQEKAETITAIYMNSISSKGKRKGTTEFGSNPETVYGGAG